MKPSDISPSFPAVIASLLVAAFLFAGVAQADPPMPVLQLDYASANPLSLVVKSKHWVEDAVGPDIRVDWTWDDNSRDALNSLDMRSLDIGSASALTALMARNTGVRVKIVYLTGQSDGSAIVVRSDSPITSIADLKGLRIASPRGSESRLFLLQALATAGLTSNDVTIVPLHADNGRVSLDRKEVDAWSTQEPDASAAEFEAGDKILYRNPALAIQGVLAVRESFLSAHPDLVEKVIHCYEQARVWAAQNPDDLAKLLAFAAKVSPKAASSGLSHIKFDNPVVDDRLQNTLQTAGAGLIAVGQLPDDTPISTVSQQLLEPKFTATLQ